jgi:hypothetical protein
MDRSPQVAAFSDARLELGLSGMSASERPIGVSRRSLLHFESIFGGERWDIVLGPIRKRNDRIADIPFTESR